MLSGFELYPRWVPLTLGHIHVYYMVESSSQRDKANAMVWLVTQEGTMGILSA